MPADMAAAAAAGLKLPAPVLRAPCSVAGLKLAAAVIGTPLCVFRPAVPAVRAPRPPGGAAAWGSW